MENDSNVFLHAFSLFAVITVKVTPYMITFHHILFNTLLLNVVSFVFLLFVIRFALYVKRIEQLYFYPHLLLLLLFYVWLSIYV